MNQRRWMSLIVLAAVAVWMSGLVMELCQGLFFEAFKTSVIIAFNVVIGWGLIYCVDRMEG